MHDKGEVRLALGSQNAGGGKARVVDEQRVIIARPLDGIGRIGDDQLKGLVVPMRRLGERVITGDVELVKADVVQVHVNAAQVVGGDVDLLTVEAIAHGVRAKHLLRLEQQRAGAAGGVYVPTDFDTIEKAFSGVKTAEKGIK